jgi:hypothetical protein
VNKLDFYKKPGKPKSTLFIYAETFGTPQWTTFQAEIWVKYGVKKFSEISRNLAKLVENGS